MNKPHTPSIICYCLLITLFFTKASHATSLLDAYNLALENDHQLKADHAEYLAGQEAAAINRASLRPTVQASATASEADADTSGTTPSETDTSSSSYTITLTQNIINASAWNTYRQGKVQAEIAKLNYQANQQALIIRTSQTYFDTLRQIDQLQTDQAEENAQKTLLEQTQQRYEVGLIPLSDVHEVQAAYDNAVANRINTEANVGIQYDALSVLTGQLHDSIVPLKKDFAVKQPEPTKKQAWVDYALQNNLSLRASELTEKSTALAAKAAKSDHLPTLDASIRYVDSNQDVDTVGGTSTITDTNTSTISLNLTIPIYTGGSLSALERQAAQTAIQSREEYLLAQRTTTQNTRSLFLSVTTAIAQIKARKQAIVSRESALESIKAGYDAGTRDIVDVTNAQSDLYQSQRDYFDTLYDYIINTLLLKQAAGNLQLADLEALENSLEQ